MYFYDNLFIEIWKFQRNLRKIIVGNSNMHTRRCILCEFQEKNAKKAGESIRWLVQTEVK